MKTSSLRPQAGFSLIELMVSVAVLSLVMVLVFQMLENTQATFKKARDSVSEYKDARNGFDAITRRMSQATLNTYWQVGRSAAGAATKFEKASDLHFVSGPTELVMGPTLPANAGPRTTHCVFFQAPTGYSAAVSTSSGSVGSLEYGNFPNLLNAWGYFVEFGDDRSERPAYLNSLANPPRPRIRFRLMEFSQLAEGLQIYAEQLSLKPKSSSPAVLNRWFLNDSSFGVNSVNNYQFATADTSALNLPPSSRMIAENIIALIVLPAEALTDKYRDKLAPNYYYDSRAFQSSNIGQAGSTLNVDKSMQALPPIVDVTMVAVDEADFKRFSQSKGVDSVSGFAACNFTTDLFKKAENYDRDLVSLRGILSDSSSGSKAKEIKFRVFRASVRLRESKGLGTVTNGKATGGN